MSTPNALEKSLIAFSIHNVKMLIGLVIVAVSTVIGVAMGFIATFKAIVWLGT